MGSSPSKAKEDNDRLQIFHPHLHKDVSNGNNVTSNQNSEYSKLFEKDEAEELKKHHEIMKELKVNIDVIKTIPDKDENGRFRESYLEGLYRIHMAFEKTGVRQSQFKFRCVIAQELSTTGVIIQFCDNVVEILGCNYESGENEDDKFEYIALKILLYLLCCVIEANSEESVIICNHPTFLKTSAEHLTAIYNRKQNIQYENVMFRLLNVLRNSSMVDSNIPLIRKNNYVEVLTLYLESGIPKVRFQAIAIMADIVNEEESEVLQKGRNSFEYIKEALVQAMKTHARRHAWLNVHVWEFVRIVKQIARNDTNKKGIVEQGFLPLLVELSSSKDPKEQTEAIATLRTLSFDKDNQKIMINDTKTCVVDRFVNLLQSPDKKIVNMCKGALWTMREELQKSDTHKNLPIVQSFTTTRYGEFKEENDRDKLIGHVMISYQWSNQQVLVRVKDHLRATGFKVWMDIDDMAGSTLEAMAKAVEEADVVLICLSKKYKDSDNCRAEAEYAFEKRKTIIPLKMEKGYKPDGWLGIIVGSKKFYDFGGKYTFESRINDLEKELRRILSHSEDVNETHKTDQIVKHDRHHTLISSVKDWTKDEVNKWLDKHGLDKERFKSLEGVEIVFLQLLLEKAVDVYYKTLTEQLNITDLKTMAKFTCALEDTTL